MDSSKKFWYNGQYVKQYSSEVLRKDVSELNLDQKGKQLKSKSLGANLLTEIELSFFLFRAIILLNYLQF